VKKVGIIGGIGPASTLDYYSGIIEGFRSRKGGDDYPEIVINSVNMNEMLHYLQTGDLNSLINMLVDAVNDLANAGAEFAAIASNTPHIVFNEVQERSGIKLISIVDETCKRALEVRCKKAVIIGTRFTMSSDLYSKALVEYGITAVVPTEEEQETIHGIIFPNLENGIVVPEEKQKMLSIANRLLAEHKADALILACTELPLMIAEGDLNTRILNTTQIHIRSIIDSI
jgi:aspartate racemase